MQDNDSKRKSQTPLLLIFLCAVLLSLVCVSSATLLAISIGTQNEIEASMLAQSEANYQQNDIQLRYGQIDPGILVEATKDAAGLAVTSEPYNLGDALENFASTAVSQIFPTAKATLLPPPSIATVAPEVMETAVSILQPTLTPTQANTATSNATSTTTATAVVPTITTTQTPTFVPTGTPTFVPTASATATQFPTSIPPAATNTPRPPATHTAVPSNTPIPTATNTVMPTSTNTAVPTFTATATNTPTPVATATATATATPTPTATAASSDVFFDDFETDLGWVTNPFASDDATTGMWERNDPEETTYDGIIYQLGTTVSGSFDLVTAAPLGSNPGADVGTNDVDNGTTSIRSPNIILPNTGTLTLSFSYYFSHYSNSSSDDFLRISIVGNTTSIVLEELGSGDKDAAVWDNFSTNIDSFAGQTIYILIETRDGSWPSLVEAAIDDVRIASN